MAIAPEVTILAPNPGTLFTAGMGNNITVSGAGAPTPDGGSVQVTVWIENPAGGKLTFIAGLGNGGTAGANWTVTFPVPAGGGGRNYAIGVRLQWINSAFPGGIATATDQILVQLN